MSKSKSVPGDTPLKQNSASTGVFVHGALEEQRAAVMDDLGNIPEVSVDFMLDHIIPNSEIDVERTIRILKRKGVLLNDGWKEFVNALPKESSNNEQTVFSKMGTIYKGIIDYTKFSDGSDGSSRTATLDFSAVPDIAPVSETKVKSRPDGCGQLKSNNSLHTSQCGYPPNNKTDYHWFNIAYVEEYKKRNSSKELDDNVLKILWSLHHIMRIDHRRRFVFGTTIENTDTRIWFCCREIVFVTHRFDFMKEPEKLVRLISSLAYANVAKLGYDPTVELFWTRCKWNYQITVKGIDKDQNVVTKIYKTTDTIADMSSNLRGRATRVYEAYEAGSSGSKVVIKDSWVDVNRTKEGDTLSELMKDASDDEKAMFLTVLVHGVVTIDGREDLTRDLLMNGYLVTTDPPKSKNDTGNYDNNVIDALEKMMADAGIVDDGMVENITQGDHVYTATIFEISRRPKPTGSQPESLVTSPDVSTSIKTIVRPRVYGAKAHYRLVFKERGESLHSMSCMRHIKLSHVVQAMHDIIEALAFLTQKGFVHRDISPGNIIFYKGRAKLSDLEFAKQYESGPSNDVRTGTYDFMAVEVEAGAYINQAGELSHNPLHDLESLWWIGVWFLLCHYQPSNLRDITVQRHIEVVKKYGETLFNNRRGLSPLSRRQALTGPVLLANIQARSFSTANQHLIVLLNSFRKQLVAHYERYKPKPNAPQNRSFFNPDLHREYGDVVEEAKKELRNDETELWPFGYIGKTIAINNANRLN